MPAALYLRPLWGTERAGLVRWRGLVLPPSLPDGAPPSFGSSSQPIAFRLTTALPGQPLYVAAAPTSNQRAPLRRVDDGVLAGWQGLGGDVKDAVDKILDDKGSGFAVALVRGYQYDTATKSRYKVDDAGAERTVYSALTDYASLSDMNKLAVLSRYVFELEAPAAFGEALPNATTIDIATASGQWQTVPAGVEHALWKDVVDAEPGKMLPTGAFAIDVRQHRSAIYFHLGDYVPTRGFTAEAVIDKDCRVRLRRSIGALPATMPVIAEFLHRTAVTAKAGSGRNMFDDPVQHGPATFDAVDHIDSIEHEGQQLHYQLDVIDVHNVVRGQTRVSVVRERFDPPPAATEVTASLVHGDQGPKQLSLEVKWPDSEREHADRLILEVWAEHRPLDECGFYGDDDLALEEILKEASLDYRTYSNPQDHKTRPIASERLQRIATKNDEHGLVSIYTMPLDTFIPKSAAKSFPSKVTISVDANDLATWLPELGADKRRIGCRYYVRLRRRHPVTNDATQVASQLVRAHHALVPSSLAKDKNPIPVFQLEGIHAAHPGRKFVSAGYLSHDDIDDHPSRPVVPPDLQAGPPITFHFTHPAPTDRDLTVGAPSSVPVGGYRMIMRDVVGPGDTTTGFELMAEIDALAPLVAAYRRVTFDAGAPWRCLGDSREGNISFADAQPVPADAARNASRLLHGHFVPNFIKRAQTDKIAAVRTRAGGGPPDKVADVSSMFGGTIAVSAPQQDATSDWPFIGRVFDALHAVGCTADLVANNDAPRGWLPLLGRVQCPPVAELPEELQDITPQAVGQLALVLITATSYDQKPLRSLRIAIVPYDWLMPLILTARKNTHDMVYDAFNLVLARRAGYPHSGAALYRLQDIGTRPVHLTVHEQRRVTHTWTELVDKQDPWHHELEVAVECLDRYEHVRPRLFGGGPTRLPTLTEVKTLEATAPIRRHVVVPRWAEIDDIPAVAPYPVALKDRIAFRVLEPPSRFTASANALARTRLGRIQLNYRPYQRMPDAERFLALLPDDVAQTWKEPAKYRAVTCLERREVSTLEPLPFSDVFELEDVPYWFTHGLTVYMSADARLGPASTAEHVRMPRVLGLASKPTYTLNNASLSISWPVARLASHLTDEELKLVALPEQQFQLDAFTANGTSIQKALAVHALPDPTTEYDFLIDIGRDPAHRRLIPLATIKLGPQAAYTPATPFGLAVTNVATKQWAAGTPPKLECKNKDDVLTLSGTVSADLAALPTDAHDRVFVRLRRDALASQPTPCF